MRTQEDARRWMDMGSKVLLDAIAGLDDEAYDAPVALPGWTRRHVTGHVAANADALVNLVRWAESGVPTPMYASPEARTAGIERGLRMSAAALDSWTRRSAALLTSSMGRLTDEQWGREVVTAQGRTVPASEIPWLRAREVCVHVVDLCLGITFDDLPDDFLAALCDDVIARRGSVPAVDGPLAQRAAWLTGRPHELPTAPDLEAWL